MEKFNGKRLGHDEALNEAQELQKRLRENYPEKKEFQADDYEAESDILDVEKAQTEEINESIEKELSQETIEEIMDKVQDINRPETGLHVFSKAFDNTTAEEILRVLSSILKKGLLGKLNSSLEDIGWADAVRKRQGAVVFFNIVGRDLKRIEDSHWFGSSGADPLPMGIIFETSDFSEETEHRNYAIDYNLGQRESLQYKPNTFGTNFPDKFETYHGNSSRVPPDDQGYALTFRVAPRYFRGLVIRPMTEMTEEEFNDFCERKYPNFPNKQILRERFRYQESDNKETRKKKATDLATLMRKICGDKVDLLLPIYDTHGNLLWPKQITYDELKKIIRKRRDSLPPTEKSSE